MRKIFISHSSRDNVWAERIHDWLKNEQKQRPQEQRFRSLFLDFDPDAWHSDRRALAGSAL